MGKPYRASLLSMLHPECTFIDGTVSQLETHIAGIRSQLINRAKLHVYWFAILVSLVVSALALSVTPLNAALVAAFFPIIAAFVFTKTATGLRCIERLSHLKGFKKYHQAIDELHGTIAGIYEKAKRYQSRLEPAGFPGFLAVYGDILRMEFFPCTIPREQRITCVEQSARGNGQQISTRVYGQLIQALKQFDFESHVNNGFSTGVDRIPARARSSVALQCAYIIATHAHKPQSHIDLFTFLHIRTIGLNAWHISNSAKVSSQWRHLQSRLFECAGQILSVSADPSSLPKDITQDFLNLVLRATSKNKQLAEQVFVIV
jgi:hypothetical protein